jgi:ribosomal protein L1
LNIPCVAKVIGYDKLKRNYKQYVSRRKLMKEYDGFLADLRIYKMLPELLGKEFYSKKKYPCPIKLHGFDSSDDLEKQLNKASAATYFMLGNGPNYSVKVGRTQQQAKDVAQNAMTALSQVIAYATVHDDISFEQICQISIRVGQASPELPIYNNIREEDLKTLLA